MNFLKRSLILGCMLMFYLSHVAYAAGSATLTLTVNKEYPDFIYVTSTANVKGPNYLEPTINQYKFAITDTNTARDSTGLHTITLTTGKDRKKMLCKITIATKVDGLLNDFTISSSDSNKCMLASAHDTTCKCNGENCKASILTLGGNGTCNLNLQK